MKRRNFIAGIGALSAGSAAAVGTGAFSSVEADRDINVEIAGDAEAYLAFESSGEYATVESDDVLELDFGDLDDLGDGVGEDSTYFFGSLQEDGEKDRVFEVRNQGTQEVELTPTWQLREFDENGDLLDSTDEAFDGGDFLNDDAEISIIIQANGVRLNDDPEDPVTESVGDSRGYFVRIYTGDNPPSSVDATFELNAEEV